MRYHTGHILSAWGLPRIPEKAAKFKPASNTLKHDKKCPQGHPKPLKLMPKASHLPSNTAIISKQKIYIENKIVYNAFSTFCFPKKAAFPGTNSSEIGSQSQLPCSLPKLQHNLQMSKMTSKGHSKSNQIQTQRLYGPTCSVGFLFCCRISQLL